MIFFFFSLLGATSEELDKFQQELEKNHKDFPSFISIISNYEIKFKKIGKNKFFIDQEAFDIIQDLKEKDKKYKKTIKLKKNNKVRFLLK